MKEFLRKNYNISSDLLNVYDKTMADIAPYLEQADKIAELNTAKVLKAFSDNNVSEAHLGTTTGYGYDDIGRDTLDKIYAQVFGAEDAIVRHNIVNGTMAIAACLFGVLRPGDTLVCATGKPYDTLEEVIGITGEPGNGSLRDLGVNYKQVDLVDNKVDFEALGEALRDPTVKAVELQRSKGYAWRNSFSVEELGEVIAFVKSVNRDIICIVDNCYGEFVSATEPTQVGADLIVGSLIKNPGGGLARSGGYIAGTARCVELVSYRLTCPGIGRECGATLNNNRSMYQGFFMAPHIVAQSVKAGILCSALFENLGFEVTPKYTELRSDIITSIKLNSSEKLVEFCKGVQQGSPIDSFVVPSPWAMPGYQDEVIMAAGAFTQGSSIEISADGPIREPYVAYFQGGITFESAKLPILFAAQNVLNVR
ncbi:MAG: methionine gamma-lyase family protein [Clostridia bacterium]|nr:methionine gamma-lyase family protein [Clostridia bacterium]